MTTAAASSLDPVWTAPVQQQVYRRMLEAMSHPGRVQDLGPWLCEESALVAVCATLVDQAVGIADPDGLLGAERLRFLAPGSVGAADADFIVRNGCRPPPPSWMPRLGTVFEPETSSTLILQVAALDVGPLRCRLTGPGIASETDWVVAGLDPAWLALRERCCSGYPLGVDCLICDASRLVALPRTTRVQRLAEEG